MFFCTQSPTDLSSLMSKYGDPIDRDSAYEQLGRRTQETAAPEEQEQAAKQQLTQASAHRQSAPAREPAARRVKEEPSGFEKFMGNSTVQQFMRSAASSIARDVFGTARKRR